MECIQLSHTLIQLGTTDGDEIDAMNIRIYKLDFYNVRKYLYRRCFEEESRMA